MASYSPLQTHDLDYQPQDAEDYVLLPGKHITSEHHTAGSLSKWPPPFMYPSARLPCFKLSNDGQGLVEWFEVQWRFFVGRNTIDVEGTWERVQFATRHASRWSLK